MQAIKVQFKNKRQKANNLIIYQHIILLFQIYILIKLIYKVILN